MIDEAEVIVYMAASRMKAVRYVSAMLTISACPLFNFALEDHWAKTFPGRSGVCNVGRLAMNSQLSVRAAVAAAVAAAVWACTTQIAHGHQWLWLRL